MNLFPIDKRPSCPIDPRAPENGRMYVSIAPEIVPERVVGAGAFPGAY